MIQKIFHVIRTNEQWNARDHPSEDPNEQSFHEHYCRAWKPKSFVNNGGAM